MSEKTKIEWATSSWSPVRGCTRVSRGCKNCYAERMSARGLPGLRSPTTGCDFAANTVSGPSWSGRVELIESQLEIPLHWKKPRRIFVNSMSDTFHEALPDAAIDRIFAVMAEAWHHTFLVLTKRPKRMLEWVSAQNQQSITRWMRCYSGAYLKQETLPGWPLSNVMLGVSVEDQETADERIPLLLQTPAAARFISLEPMLAPVELELYLFGTVGSTAGYFVDGRRIGGGVGGQTMCSRPLNALHLVILGGESGRGARPMNLDWARKIRDQCSASGVAFFFKQAIIGGKRISLPELDGHQYANFPIVK